MLFLKLAIKTIFLLTFLSNTIKIVENLKKGVTNGYF